MVALDALYVSATLANIFNLIRRASIGAADGPRILNLLVASNIHDEIGIVMRLVDYLILFLMYSGPGFYHPK